MSASEGWSDARVETAVAVLLRLGVGVASTLVAFGGAVYVARHGAEAPRYGAFRGEPMELTTVAGILHGARAGSGRALIQLGLLTLIATPIARVAFSLLTFALQRDWMYVIVTFIVLSLLLLSVTGHLS